MRLQTGIRRYCLMGGLLGLLLIGAACGGTESVDTSANVVAPTVVAPTLAVVATATTESNQLALDTEPTAPIVVTAFTPAQGEGPYYPVAKLADQDNDLTRVNDGAVAAGDILLLNGRVFDRNGYPVAGAVVEIWQTDAQGVYLHPNDPGFANLDPNFQGYGEAITAVDGSYQFRTILPGLYEPRPRHIHFKVKLDGVEWLTSQLYFVGDDRLGTDGLAAAAGTELAMLTLQLQPGTDNDGNPVQTAEGNIILGNYALD